MSEETPKDQDTPEPPTCVVCLIEPDLDQLHDGFALASYLRINGVSCPLRRFGGAVLKTEAARQLREAATDLVLYATSERNLDRVQQVAGLLGDQRLACLFGRQLSDPALRERVSYPPAHGAIVGEPYRPALDLASRDRRSVGHDLRVAGLYHPERPMVPLAPMSDVGAVPPGDFGEHPDLIAWGIPLYTSRSYPWPLVSSARRQWESPVRGQHPERVAEDMQRYGADFGARHFIFTDLSANAVPGALLGVAEAILARGLDVFWTARIWPDPALDRAAVCALARSGCRGLELDVLTASARLGEELCSGVEMDAVDALIRRCRQEGIPVKPRLVIGFPGETRDDRLATCAWLARQAGAVETVHLEACRIRHGAPLFWHQDVYYPADRAADQWHDGGENNQSKRTVWLGELAGWTDNLGLRRRGDEVSPKPATARRVCGRIAEGVDELLLADPGWKRERLVLSGVMHGREAFCGPRTLHLDLVGMATEAAVELVGQAAAMGARELALGRPDAPDAEDVLGCDALDEVLAAARCRDLEITIRTGLAGEVEADRLRQVAAGVQRLEVEARGHDQWERLERWIPAVAQARADRQAAGPQVHMRAWLDADHPDLRAAVERAAGLGVDRLQLALEREEDGRMTTDQLTAAARQLEELLEGHDFGAPVSTPDHADTRLWRGASRGGTLLALDGGWPPGFVFTRGETQGAWACTCPAGAVSSELHQHCAHPAAVFATFSEPTCRECPMLWDCPVGREDATVRVRLLLLEGVARLQEDLQDADSGLGRAQGTLDAEPCLVGWTEARVDAAGELYVCAECGGEPVGNALSSSLASVWYSRELNEFRRMTLGASLALPFIDRRACGLRCRRLGDNLRLMAKINGMEEPLRDVLEQAGAGDRLLPCSGDSD